VDEAHGLNHSELRGNVGLDGWRCGGGKSENRNRTRTVAQCGNVLPDHAVVGTEIVAPLRNAVGFVDGDEGRWALGQHLWKAGNAQALRCDEKKVEGAGEVVDAGLARDGTIEAGVDAGHAQVERGELGDLVFHERDERRDDERGSAKRYGWKLVAERLPCPGGHDEEQVAAIDGSAAHRFLVGAEAREAEDRVEKLGEIFRVGWIGQIESDLSRGERV